MQPDDLSSQQLPDNRNDSTDSTDNSEALEKQGELHIDVSSEECHNSALTGGAHETNIPGCSFNSEVLTKHSTSIVRATSLSSSRLDSRHHDLSRHLDSMFTDVTLELQSKDTKLNQLVHEILARV